MPLDSRIINNNTTNTAGSGSISSSRQTRTASISSTSHSDSVIAEGQIIKGEVTDIRGKNVTISLTDNTLLTGTMRDISNLYIGQTTAFRVASITPRLITLESLLGDINNQENLAVRKALDEAELPLSERNISIVRELLNNRMSINKETIQEIIRQSSSLNNVSPETVILMNKYNIPTTQALASQFENYRNGDNSLIQDIDILSERIPTLLEELSANADAEPVAGFGSKLMSVISEHIVNNPKPHLSADLSTFSAPERNELVNYINEATALLPDTTYNNETITNITAGITNGTASVEDVFRLINDLSEIIANNNSDSTGLPELIRLPDSYNKLFTQNDYIQFNNNSLIHFLDQNSRTELTELIKPLINDNNIISSISNGTITAETLFTTINQNITSSIDDAAKLFSNKVFTEVFRKVIHNSWTISARELANTNNIAEHYRELADELMKTSELIERNLSGTSSALLTEQTSKMSDNINFMNELNNYLQYVQLPIRFQDQTAHGDLYVYTKKDELKRHPDKVSVLLHLNFEHLGNLDIHISKDKSRIDSTFSCPDADTVNLIRTNMHMLKDTLAEKGFIFSATVNESSAKQDIIKNFLEQTVTMDGRTPAQGNLNRYAFDLRA